MNAFVITQLTESDHSVEIVERKGIGHPDTICDAIAENLSRALCREYQRRFGRILHHNVDKALLCGGQSSPVFGGGRMLSPVRMFIGGRVVDAIGSDRVPITDLAAETARAWLKANLHAFDSEQHVSIECEIRPGVVGFASTFPDPVPRTACE